MKNDLGLVHHELPANLAEWFGFIEKRLIEVYDPQTRREWAAIAELAEARQSLFDMERRYDLRLRREADRAAEVFDRQLMDDYFRLDRLWRKNVHATHAVFTRNPHAVAAVARNWAALAESLAPEGVGIADFSQALEAVMAEGLAWRVQELTPDAWWIMGRALATAVNPEDYILQWVKRSGLKKGDPHAERIREKLKALPNAGECRRQLHERATIRAREWAGRLSELQSKVENERAALAEMAMGVGEKGQAAEMRSARSILKFHRDRVEKLLRNLAALQKERRGLEARDERVPDRVLPLVRAKLQKQRAEAEAEAARQKLPQVAAADEKPLLGQSLFKNQNSPEAPTEPRPKTAQRVGEPTGPFALTS